VWLHIGCIFAISIWSHGLHSNLKPLHRSNRVSVHSLDVNLSCCVDAAMAKDGLNRAIVHPETVQVRCESAAEWVPPAPTLIVCG
jgi:hypothetical protein